MPIIKSAKKRVKIAGKANSRNSRTKRSMREAIRAFENAIESDKQAEIQKAASAAASAIDTAAKKNVIHKNKASNNKSKLTKFVNALS